MKSVSSVVMVSALFVLSLAGCARNQIVVDKKDVDMAAYERDLAECRTYSEETDSVGADTVKGAIGGAVVGGLVGAVVGNSRTAERLGGGGAVMGAVRGGQKSKVEKQQIVKNCLKGRGYKVLN